MKKGLILAAVLVLAAIAAVVTWYEPARNAAQQGWEGSVVPAWNTVRTAGAEWVGGLMSRQETPVAMAEKNEKAETPEPQAQNPETVSGDAAETPAVDPAPASSSETQTAPGVVPVPDAEPQQPTVAEPQAEPEPVVPVALPALNTEAELLLPKAEAGDAVAQFNLARQYSLGEGMSINREEFIRWCRIAADQGLPEAQYTLGCCYLRGLVVEKNEAEGRRLLEAAAASDFAPAAELLKQ